MKEKLNNLPNSYKENIKKATKILKILLLIFIIWIIFAIADCFRISNLNEKSKPLITIATKEYDNVEQKETPDGDVIEVGEYGKIYIGLGYTKKYYRKWQIDKVTARTGYLVYLLGFIRIGEFQDC